MEKTQQINSTIIDCRPEKQTSGGNWVRETRFGRWFLTTNMWYQRVLSVALFDLIRLLGDKVPKTRQILDAGCGGGLAFSLLEHNFQPETIIGVDIDRHQLSAASAAAKYCGCDVKIINGGIGDLNIPDDSIDVIFSHQLLHHVTAQAETLKEFYRILAPGGIVLISESCRPFIYSLPVRLLFRHPMQVQKSADEYVDLVKSCGFTVKENHIQTSTPWWSQQDFGVTEKLGLSHKAKEATEILMIARKP